MYFFSLVPDINFWRFFPLVSSRLECEGKEKTPHESGSCTPSFSNPRLLLKNVSMNYSSLKPLGSQASRRMFSELFHHRVYLQSFGSHTQFVANWWRCLVAQSNSEPQRIAGILQAGKKCMLSQTMFSCLIRYPGHFSLLFVRPSSSWGCSETKGCTHTVTAAAAPFLFTDVCN